MLTIHVKGARGRCSPCHCGSRKVVKNDILQLEKRPARHDTRAACLECLFALALRFVNGDLDRGGRG